MNLKAALKLKQGDYIHHKVRKNSDGSPMRARITSIKTWKRSPDRIEIRYKRGLYEYGAICEYELEDFEPGYGADAAATERGAARIEELSPPVNAGSREPGTW